MTVGLYVEMNLSFADIKDAVNWDVFPMVLIPLFLLIGKLEEIEISMGCGFISRMTEQDPEISENTSTAEFSNVWNPAKFEPSTN